MAMRDYAADKGRTFLLHNSVILIIQCFSPPYALFRF